MSKLLGKLGAYVKRYPVRVRAYGVAVLLLGWLVHSGYIEPFSAQTAGVIVATVLGVKETERHTVPVVKGTRRRRRKRR